MIKKLLIAASLLLIIGVIGGIATYKKASELVEIKETESVDFNGIKRLTVNGISSNIQLIGTDKIEDDNIVLSGKARKNNPATLQVVVNVENDEIILNALAGGNGNKWFNFNVELFKNNTTLKAYIPKKLLETLEVDMVSGDTKLENLTVNELGIDTVSGDVDGEQLNFKKSNIESTSGDVTLKNFNGKLNVDTTSGDITLTKAALTESLELDTTSGNIHITTKEAPENTKFKIDTISGNVNIYERYKKQTSLGDGSVPIFADTVSGNIQFKQQ